MRIVSLEPFLTEIVCYFGLEQQLVGLSHRCDYPESILNLPRLTSARSGDDGTLRSALSPDLVDVPALLSLKPDIVLTSIQDDLGSDANFKRARLLLSEGGPLDLQLHSFNPFSLEHVFSMYEEIGKVLRAPAAGRDLAQRLKSQFMDWGDNFYDRMKNKRVTFLSHTEPFVLAGRWIPDMVHMASAVSQAATGGEEATIIDWGDVVKFRPDVIVVALQDKNIQDATRAFLTLEKLPQWEDIPAVKRGEVIFTDGKSHFYRPGPRLRESMAILISAIAGLESGYISPRDCFYRLRWLEMQRHRIGKS